MIIFKRSCFLHNSNMEHIKGKFVKIQMIPENETKRSQFQQYRLQDNEEFTWVLPMIYTTHFVVSIYKFSTEANWSTFGQLLPLIVIFVMLLTIRLLRKRIKNCIPHAYILTQILTLSQIVFGTPMAIAVMSPEMQELTAGAKLRSQIGECFKATAFVASLGTPSL